MTDAQIIALFWDRDEEAIRQTHAVYGQRLHRLADQILRSPQDSEESVSDTYLKAWETIPPQRPAFFYAYLAKICRNFALGRLEMQSAAKRNAQIVELTREMELSIPDPAHQRALEGDQIGELLNRFLATLSRDNRLIFLRRYWYADSVAEIAARYRISESKVKTQLHRTRNKLRNYLAKEGITV